jgi:lipopolysaccharide export system protein LptC
MNYKSPIILLFLVISMIAFSQEETQTTQATYTYNKNKGKAYIYCKYMLLG